MAQIVSRVREAYELFGRWLSVVSDGLRRNLTGMSKAQSVSSPLCSQCDSDALWCDAGLCRSKLSFVTRDALCLCAISCRISVRPSIRLSVSHDLVPIPVHRERV